MPKVSRSLYRWLPLLVVAAVVALVVVPLQSQEKKAAAPPPSSYDQVSPVLLGQETFKSMLEKDQAGQGQGHGAAEEAPGRAL